MVTATQSRTETEKGSLRLAGRGQGARRWRSAAVAVALVLAGSSLAVVALNQVDQRTPVLVAAGDLPAGHQLTTSDVQVVDLAGAGDLPTVSDIEVAVGSILTLPVREGALLSQGVLGEPGDQLADHQAVVGAQVPPGRVPSSVEPGTSVVVVMTGDEAGDVSYPALVQTVTPLSEDPSGELLLDLVVDASHAAIVTRAAAEGEVALVHTAHDGGEEE